MIASAFILSVLGMACLALAMRRHHRQVLRRDPGPVTRIGFRLSGASALALSLVACAEAWGWPIGSVAWFGVLTVGAVVVLGVLSAVASRGAKARA